LNPYKVYLADLTHTGNGVATESFPLNVGLIGSYAKKVFGNDISIELFKYPEDLQEAINQNPPNLLGCSNYTWNSNLSYYFCNLVKSLDTEIITVFGGTNYPFDGESQEKFLRQRPNLDLHIYYEGEQSFSNLLERCLSRSNRSETINEPIAGCQFISQRTGKFVSGPPSPRISDLDSIPSPYVSGILDKFFDGQLTPLVETARGCPFTCNFCNAYHEYFTKVNKFSDEYVREELTYIAAKASSVGAGHITLADNNFGMIPRDARTAQLFAELREKYGWPSSVTAWTGKNAKERVIDVTKVLGGLLSISMSVQSTDANVLEQVGRKNIKMDDYKGIAEDLNAQGRPQHAEVIIPLPGETLGSHISGLKELLDTKVSQVFSHTLQMLHGTPYKDDQEYRRSHGYVTKFRIVPLDFSRIGEEMVFDIEEVGVATSTFSFADYVESRKYLLLVDLCYNSSVFNPLIKYLADCNIQPSEWIDYLWAGRGRLDEDISIIFESFEHETKSELWDSEQEMVDYYSQPKNYDRLVNYEVGGNVLFKHRIWMLSQKSNQWVDAVFEQTKALLIDRASPKDIQSLYNELDSLKSFVTYTVAGALSPEGVDSPVSSSFSYDIPAWLKSAQGESLKDFIDESRVDLIFHFAPQTLTIIKDGFARYGTDVPGITKLVQRVAGVGFTKSVSYASGSVDSMGTNETSLHFGPGHNSI